MCLQTPDNPMSLFNSCCKVTPQQFLKQLSHKRLQSSQTHDKSQNDEKKEMPIAKMNAYELPQPTIYKERLQVGCRMEGPTSNMVCFIKINNTCMCRQYMYMCVENLDCFYLGIRYCYSDSKIHFQQILQYGNQS